MKVICRKIISPTTKRDLGEKSTWFKVGNEYVVLAVELNPREGVSLCVRTEHHGQISLISAEGFEFVNQYIPSSWITKVQDFYGKPGMMMLPASWDYEYFFDDFEEGESKAVELFRHEAEKIYQEEEDQALAILMRSRT